MDFAIRMFDAKPRNNIRNKSIKKRISKRRKRVEEASKTAFNRFEENQREVIFKFFSDIRSNNRFSRNNTSNNKRNNFKMRYR